MPGKTIHIDGYNVIHRGAGPRHNVCEKNLPRLRIKLIQYCADWLEKRGDVAEFIIYFDGSPGLVNIKESRQGVKVVYTYSQETADDRILACIAGRADKADMTVVSDDLAVIRGAKREGASCMSVREFLAVLGASNNMKKSRQESSFSKSLPPNASAITKELERLWGAEE